MKQLKLNMYHLYDPSGWKEYDKSYSRTITIKAIEGEIDPENVMALPEFGFPDKSGGNWYSNINKLQGTDGWQMYSEARHGNDWFFWRKIKATTKELEVRLIVRKNVPAPEFPVSFSLRLPDKNYKKSLRVWLTLTKPPDTTPVPLLLTKNFLFIDEDEVEIPIQQGEYSQVWAPDGVNVSDKTIFINTFYPKYEFKFKDKNMDRYVYLTLISNR
jgi:hypothetical protein